MLTDTPLTAEFDATVLAAALPRHVCAGHMRYRTLKPLTRGGKAEILCGDDGLLGREVAIKVLHRHLCGQAVEEQLLVREARIMAALHHAAIPPVHDLGRDPDGRPYIAMEMRHGATLHEVLTALRRGDPDAAPRFDLERLLGILVRVAEVLEYVHGMNIVHCDLKPENIIIDATDSVSLIDWGLAIVDDYAATGDENPAVVLRGRQGSPLYMAPEQAAAEPLLTAAVDVYGLGVLLYECLSLETPCRGESASETLHNLQHCAPVPPRISASLRPMTRELEQACMKALAKSPADRFGTMAEFAAALRDCWTELLIAFERSDAAPRRAPGSVTGWDDVLDSQRRTDRVPTTAALLGA
jgi:eukaryotic-like serine/threonine-protein kinase